MFIEKILQTTKNPIVFAEQKITTPTERLVRALKVAEILGLSLVNLTYLGAPFVDPKRGDFNLLKPRILTSSGLIMPSIGGNQSGSSSAKLKTSDGNSIQDFYKKLAELRAEDFRLSLEQITWLLAPQEFDMTDFYLQASGRDSQTRESIASLYLPVYYEELGDSQVPVIVDFDRLAESSKRLVDKFGVQIIDLPDLDVDLDYSIPKDFSGRSYIDLSMSSANPLSLI